MIKKIAILVLALSLIASTVWAVSLIGSGPSGGASPMSTETVRPDADVCYNDTGACGGTAQAEASYEWKDHSSNVLDGSTYEGWDLIDEASADDADFIMAYDGAGSPVGVGVLGMADATGSGTISSIVIHARTLNASSESTIAVSISGDAGSSWESAQSLTITVTSFTENTCTFNPTSWTDSNVKSNNLQVRLVCTQDGVWSEDRVSQLWAVINP